MPDGLVLSTVGIKAVSDPRDTRTRPSAESSGRPRSAPLTLVRNPTSNPRCRRVLSPTPIIAESPVAPAAPPLRTPSLQLDHDLATKLERIARAAGVSPHGLAIAALERALSDEPDRLRVRDTRPRTRGSSKRRSVRLPDHVRERADELARADHTTPLRTARSRLVNNAIRRGLPDDPRVALALVIVAATAARAAR